MTEIIHITLFHREGGTKTIVADDIATAKEKAKFISTEKFKNQYLAATLPHVAEMGDNGFYRAIPLDWEKYFAEFK